MHALRQHGTSSRTGVRSPDLRSVHRRLGREALPRVQRARRHPLPTLVQTVGVLVSALEVRGDPRGRFEDDDAVQADGSFQVHAFVCVRGSSPADRRFCAVGKKVVRPSQQR